MKNFQKFWQKRESILQWCVQALTGPVSVRNEARILKIFIFYFTMRNLWWKDPTLFTVPIEDILIDPDSRDHIPRVLRALQAIWMRPEIRDRILTIIQGQVGKGIRQDTGRPGMTYWSIFVLLLLKQSMKATFDLVTELSNQHKNLRIMLQVETEYKDELRFKRQTITQNVGLISEASWQQINEIVVEMGYNLMANSKATPEQGSCDSYVVETNVRFPTDVRLLHDATWKLLRRSYKAWKVLELRQVCSLKGWRQLAHLRKSLYAAYLVVSTTRKCRSNPEAVLSYLDLCMLRINKCLIQLELIQKRFPDSEWVQELQILSEQALKLHDQVRRRLVEGEDIPNEEKIYSLHAPHTRWIRKGKSRPKDVELGVPVTICQSPLGLILWWKIMWTEVDVAITEEVVRKILDRYPTIHTLSFDRGFSSKENLEAIQSLLPHPILPKKGRLSKADRERQSTPEFKKARKQHVLIESRINCLEHHGGDRVRTKGGKEGFARTVGASIVATNLCQIGRFLMAQDREQLRKAA